MWELGVKAVGPLLHSLNDGKPGNTEAVRDTLIKIGPPAVEPIIDTFVKVNTSGEFSVLVAIGEPSVKPLLAALKTPGLDGFKISVIQTTLKQIGLPAAGPLFAAASDENPVTRLAVASILFAGYCTSFDGPIFVCNTPEGDTLMRATEVLNAMLHDPSPIVRYTAVDSITNLSWMQKEQEAILTAALSDPDADVRARAAVGLQRVGTGGGMLQLIAALKDEDTQVRNEAALALIHLGQSGVDALVETFSSGDLVAAVQDHERIIQEGDYDSIPVLVAALFTEGGSIMANTFLNCGSPWLGKAAEAWALANGMTVTFSPGGQSAGVTWGADGQ